MLAHGLGHIEAEIADCPFAFDRGHFAYSLGIGGA
jgi:hypothetical protein